MRNQTPARGQRGQSVVPSRPHKQGNWPPWMKWIIVTIVGMMLVLFLLMVASKPVHETSTNPSTPTQYVKQTDVPPQPFRNQRPPAPAPKSEPVEARPAPITDTEVNARISPERPAPQPPVPNPGPAPSVPVVAAGESGRVRGVLTDRRGNPVSGMIVSIRRGPETRSDAGGQFVLNDTPLGDHVIVVKSPSEKGEWIQNITIQTNGTTDAKIVYDSGSSRLGLLSIAAPVDGSEVSLRYNGLDFLAQVHGRCDGLLDILGRFDVWVLIRSDLDEFFWVQRPAIVDPTANNWRADVRFGNRQTPPRNGDTWHLVVVAAPIDSQIKRIEKTPLLSLLPQPHVGGNVVTVTSKIRR